MQCPLKWSGCFSAWPASHVSKGRMRRVEILRRNLDDEQRHIAQIEDGNLLVLAGPGSGKTRLLTNAAAYRLRRYPNDTWRICCLTFTVEAARQLRSRLQSAELGSVPTRRLWVGNFHQFSQMLLGSYGHLLGWPRTAGIITPVEAEALLRELVTELRLGNVNILDVRSAISATKGRRPVLGEWDRRSESFIRLSQAYQARLKEAGLRDFDDLIVDALRLLKENQGVRRIIQDVYRHVFVDELQDTNQMQLDLLGALVDGAPVRIFGVADADQMIYAWRDARPENLREFEERFQARVHSLGGNYRCPARIVQAATAIITNNPDRERAAQDLRSLVTDKDGELWEGIAADAQTELGLVCDVIAHSLEDGTAPSDIAVLAPHRFKFSDLRTALETRQIPFVYIGSNDMEVCPVIGVFRACLVGLANPAQPLRVAAVIERANRHMGRAWVSQEIIEQAIRAASQTPPERLFAVLLNALGVERVMEGLPSGVAERIQRLRLMIAVSNAETPADSGAQLAHRVLLEWARLEAAVLRSDQSVKLMTTFNAKGLEFHTVILPFCTKTLVPWIPAAERQNTKRWHEARRTFYVAMTRSTHRIIFTRVGNEARSVFLEEIPPELLTPWNPILRTKD